MAETSWKSPVSKSAGAFGAGVIKQLGEMHSAFTDFSSRLQLREPRALGFSVAVKVTTSLNAAPAAVGSKRLTAELKDPRPAGPLVGPIRIAACDGESPSPGTSSMSRDSPPARTVSETA